MRAIKGKRNNEKKRQEDEYRKRKKKLDRKGQKKRREKEKGKRINRETLHEKIIDILIKLNERIFISSSTHLFM